MGRRGQGAGNAPLTRPSGAPGSSAGASQWAEELAARRLTDDGWRLLARNYRLRGGELDLVCEDEDGVVVFVEVKQRKSVGYGGAAAAIDARKRERLRRTAVHFLSYRLRRPDAATRFDAVLVTGTPTKHHYEHLRDAW